MNCPSCGAPMRLEEDKDFFRCDYCKNVYFPEPNEDGIRVLGEPSPMNCPVCAVPLVHAAVGGTRLLYCERCRGLLMPMGGFMELIENVRARIGSPSIVQGPTDRTALKRELTCPQCHRRMDTHPYGGPGNIVIDSCSKCYLNWLDYGELMRVARAPDHALDVEDLPTSSDLEP